MKTKRLLLSFVALLSMTHAMADVEINETNFPDANFRNYLLSQNYDYDGDGLITDYEIANVTSILVSDMNISSLKGIEFFTALTTLYCESNQLTTLDVSKNTALETLYCYDNQLTTLDVSKNTALKTLYCHNNQLTSLNVTGCTSLSSSYEDTPLICYGNQIKGAAMDAFIESLPVPENRDNYRLEIIRNENEGNVMTEAQVAAAKAKGWKPLVYNIEFVIWYPYLGADVSEPEPIDINETVFPDANFRNEISSNFDLNKDGKLEYMEMENLSYIWVDEMGISSLKGIEFLTALTYLSCKNNQLTSLDLSKNTALTGLSCGNNQLTSLDLSKNTALTTLSCDNNQLTTLDVSKNTALTTLYCNNNQLTTLDVLKNTALELLVCDNNQLTTLHVSGLPVLHTLSCNSNQLTTLDISGCISLGADTQLGSERGKLNCAQNKIKGASMDALIASLPNNSGMLYAIYFENEGNVMTVAQVAAVRAKGWKPMACNETNAWLPYLGEGVAEPAPVDINETNFPDGIFRNYVSSNFDLNQNGKLEYAEIASATNIKVNKMDIQSMKGIEYFTELEQLKCKDNQLSSIDLSKNMLLFTLDITRNQLTALDISKNLGLRNLYVAENQLTTLDVSKHSALVQLECSENQLTALDLSNKPKLYSLYCDNNQLTALDFSEAPVLYSLWCYNNQIKGAAMDVLVNSLPQYKDKYGATQGTFRALSTKETEGNVMTTAQVAVAKAKGWIPNIGEWYYEWYYDGEGQLYGKDRYNWRMYEGSEASGIKSIKTIGSDENVSDDQAKWYDLSGRRLTGKPERKGIYIRNGKKVVMK